MNNNVKSRLINTVSVSGMVLALSFGISNVQTVYALPTVQELDSEETSIVELIGEQEVTLVEMIELIKMKEEDVLVLMSDISEKEDELRILQVDIDKKDKEMLELEEIIKENEHELEIKIEQYNKNIALATERAQTLQKEEKDKVTMYLSVLLEANSLSDMFAGMRAVNVMLEAHEKQIIDIKKQADEIRLVKKELDSDRNSLLKEKRVLDGMRDDLEDDKGQLLLEKNEADKIIKTLDSEKKAIESAYNRNLDELFAVQETKNGMELLDAMMAMENQSNSSDVTISSNGVNSINSALSEIRSKQPNASTVSTVLSEARKHLGVPYLWGGTTTAGFDCSGLTRYVYGKAGINLPRTSSQQATVGTSIPVSQAQPGDLLFWDRGGKVYHVAIYIGEGNFIHAPRPGKSVNITNVKHFTPSSARRVIPVSTQTSNVQQADSTKGDLIGTFSATAYAVGAWAVPGTVTANGTDISESIYTKDGHRIIAVDTNVIPMNSIVTVEVPGQKPFTAKASDTGGAIKGNIVDILFGSVSEAKQFGRKHGIKIYKK